MGFPVAASRPMVTCAIQRPSGRRVMEPSLFPRFFAMCGISSVLCAEAYQSEDCIPGMPMAVMPLPAPVLATVSPLLPRPSDTRRGTAACHLRLVPPSTACSHSVLSAWRVLLCRRGGRAFLPPWWLLAVTQFFDGYQVHAQGIPEHARFRSGESHAAEVGCYLAVRVRRGGIGG